MQYVKYIKSINIAKEFNNGVTNNVFWAKK